MGWDQTMPFANGSDLQMVSYNDVTLHRNITLALRFTENGKAAQGLSHKVGPTFYERVFGAKPVSKLTVCTGAFCRSSKEGNLRT